MSAYFSARISGFQERRDDQAATAHWLLLYLCARW